MKAELTDDMLVVKDKKQIQRLHQRGFGTLKEGELGLSPLESLFLIDRGTLNAVIEGNDLGRDELIERFGKEPEFLRRYSVYKDLREKGYVVKSGFKFGAHFRVYERGEFSQDGHSALLVHVVPEDEEFGFAELSRAVRLTQSVKKSLMFAVVDYEGDITYYQVDRITP